VLLLYNVADNDNEEMNVFWNILIYLVSDDKYTIGYEKENSLERIWCIPPNAWICPGYLNTFEFIISQ